MGSLWVGHDLAALLSLFTFMHWKRKWQPTPVFLSGESQGQGAWWAAIYEVAQSRTWLKQLRSSSSSIRNEDSQAPSQTNWIRIWFFFPNKIPMWFYANLTVKNYYLPVKSEDTIMQNKLKHKMCQQCHLTNRKTLLTFWHILISKKSMPSILFVTHSFSIALWGRGPLR